MTPLSLLISFNFVDIFFFYLSVKELRCTVRVDSLQLHSLLEEALGYQASLYVQGGAMTARKVDDLSFLEEFIGNFTDAIVNGETHPGCFRALSSVHFLYAGVFISKCLSSSSNGLQLDVKDFDGKFEDIFKNFCCNGIPHNGSDEVITLMTNIAIMHSWSTQSRMRKESYFVLSHTAVSPLLEILKDHILVLVDEHSVIAREKRCRLLSGFVRLLSSIFLSFQTVFPAVSVLLNY